MRARPRRPIRASGYTRAAVPLASLKRWRPPSMKVSVITDQPWLVPADVLVVPIGAETEPGANGTLREIDKRSGGELTALRAFGELSGKKYSTAMAAAGKVRAGRLLAVGVGPVAKVDRETVVRMAATAERRLGSRQVRSMAVVLDALQTVDGGLAGVAEAVTRGVVEGSFDPATIYREKVDSAPPVLDELILIAPGAESDRRAIERGAERGRIMGEGANRARRLSNRAANDVTPEVLADEARAIAKQHGLWIDVIEPDRARKLGMGMFLAVGQGSDNPPRMIVMRSGKKGEKDARGRHLAIIGKGVCFDSGGISIKPSEAMEQMKMDKTGACTVISAIATVAELAPGTPLLAVAPAVENMPGPHSARPGDIVRALNGKWVDIINTDAEGRLILGDAMTYAERLGATHLVDVATLTGAVGRTLGHLVAGGFGTPQGWYDEVMTAAARAGERFWQMPLVDEYMSDLESWYGDIVNSGSVEGSLVKSGLFLREFATVPWVHLDIAGTAYFRKTLPFAARGSTGIAHATLVELALAGAPAPASANAART
ncbi:MAG: leucyl aminopeptidase, partial [Chloroflexi bacterium]|nr:leucyl aminopeptidase [Chloroflexota bacterium]